MYGPRWHPPQQRPYSIRKGGRMPEKGCSPLKRGRQGWWMVVGEGSCAQAPGVSMVPGPTAFTRTRSSVKSIAQHLVSCATPPFETLSATRLHDLRGEESVCVCAVVVGWGGGGVGVRGGGGGVRTGDEFGLGDPAGDGGDVHDRAAGARVQPLHTCTRQRVHLHIGGLSEVVGRGGRGAHRGPGRWRRRGRRACSCACAAARA